MWWLSLVARNLSSLLNRVSGKFAFCKILRIFLLNHLLCTPVVQALL
jgi:hypothetical protein